MNKPHIALIWIVVINVFAVALHAQPVQPAPDSIVQIIAEAQGLQLVPPDQVPPSGTFWVVQPGTGLFPVPLPCPPNDPGFPIFQIAEGQFLADETGGQVLPNAPQAGRLATSATVSSVLDAQANAIMDLINRVQGAQLNRQLTAAFGTDGFSLDGGGHAYTTSYLRYAFDTNSLWLEVISVDLGNQQANLLAHNTTDTNYYQLLSKTNLLQPNWILWPIKSGDSGTDQTAFNNVSIGENPTMFFRAHQADWRIYLQAGSEAIEPYGGIPGQNGSFYLSGQCDGVTNDLTVSYIVSGTATSGVDYTNLSGVATLTNGAGYTEIDVSPMADNLVEGSETVTLTLVPTNTCLIYPGQDSATIHILDSSTTLEIQTLSDAFEPDGPPGVAAGHGLFQVTRFDSRSILTNLLTVRYLISGTASNGVDYTTLSGILNFAPDIAYTNIDITPLKDNLPEGMETVTLTLIPTNGYLLEADNSSATLAVYDSSTTVSLNVSAYSAIEPDGPPGVPAEVASFKVSRIDTRGIYTNMAVHYVVSGTASNGVDYIALSGTLYFAPDITDTNIDITPLKDNLPEGTETVTVTLVDAATNGYFINTNNMSGTVTIDDTTTTVSLRVWSSTAIEPDGPPGAPAVPASFRVSRYDLRGIYTNMPVRYVVSGTASNGLDYAALSGTLYFAPDITDTNIDITPLKDNLPEGTETVTVTLVDAATNGYLFDLTRTSGTATIIDSTTTVSINPVIATGIEPNNPPGAPGAPFSFAINRLDSRFLFTNMVVSYAVSGTASNGVDYPLLSGKVNFLPGMLHTNIVVMPLEDNLIEGQETVILTLLDNGTNGYYIDTNSMGATNYIIDTTTSVSLTAKANGAEPYPGSQTPVQEGYFEVDRADWLGTLPSMTVNYQISGTASNGLDYTLLNGSVAFAAGATATNIYVHPFSDFLTEGTETVTLTLIPNVTNADSYLVNSNLASATITIADNTNMFAPVANVGGPIGLDYFAPSNCLVVSYNFSGSGNPNNFALISTNPSGSGASVRAWSGVHGLADEIKLATVKTNASGFTNGDMYFSSSNSIGWLSADGTRSNLNWSPLTNSVLTNTLTLRGSLYVDQTGIFSNNVLAVTSEGLGSSSKKGVWRVDAQGRSTLLSNITTAHLEGLITLPNDTNRWGPWAGKIITGDEANTPPLIYSINPSGIVQAYNTTNFISGGIHPEDFDIIPPNQDLYATDPDRNQIVKVSRGYFTNNIGDLLITDAGENVSPSLGKLFIVHWDSATTNFVTRSIPFIRSDGSLGYFEHVSFAPIQLQP